MPAITKPMTTQPDAAHDYICDLEEQVKQALTDLQNALANYNVLNSRFSKTVAWLAQLKVYCDAIEKTNLCGETMISLLGSSINQSCVVADSTSFGVDALRYLLLDLEQVSCCTEKLQKKVDDLKNILPPLDATDSIFVAIKNLQDGLKEAMTCIKEAIANLLATLEMAEILWKGLADSTNSPGLAGYLEILLEAFSTVGSSRPDYTACPSGACPQIKFPLDDSGNVYYATTIASCDAVEDEIYDTGGLRDQLEGAEGDKDAAQTCYDALKAALDAAKAAKACAVKK